MLNTLVSICVAKIVQSPVLYCNCMLAMYNLNCMFSGMEGCRRGTVQMGTLQRGFARRKIGAITIQVQTNEGMNARSAKI